MVRTLVTRNSYLISALRPCDRDALRAVVRKWRLANCIDNRQEPGLYALEGGHKKTIIAWHKTTGERAMKGYTAALPSGEAIHYIDRKRWLWLLSVFYPLQPFLGIWLHAETGNQA